MRNIFVLLACWAACGAAAMAQQAPRPAPQAANGSKGGHAAIRGFTLKSAKPTASGVVETWQSTANASVLRLEVINHASDALAEARLKAVNAKVGTQGQQPEELMFRCETSPQSLGWTNYQATHHITFKTYRYWKLQGTTLMMSDVTFSKGKPSFDEARAAFIAAKRAADNAVNASSATAPGAGQPVPPAKR